MINSVQNITIFEEILRTNRVLDDDNHTWEHYFWTNDVSLELSNGSLTMVSSSENLRIYLRTYMTL